MLLDAIYMGLLLSPLAFFWCACNQAVTCFTVCATQTETLVLTVPDDTFDAVGGFRSCEESRCNERCGEWILAKVATEDMEDLWPRVAGVPNYQPDAGYCLWVGEEFEACQSGEYVDPDLGPQPEQVVTLRWSYATVPSFVGAHDCYVALEPIGSPFEYFAWYAGADDVRDCDPLDFAWLQQTGVFFDGCQVDITKLLTVSFPP